MAPSRECRLQGVHKELHTRRDKPTVRYDGPHVQIFHLRILQVEPNQGAVKQPLMKIPVRQHAETQALNASSSDGVNAGSSHSARDAPSSLGPARDERRHRQFHSRPNAYINASELAFGAPKLPGASVGRLINGPSANINKRLGLTLLTSDADRTKVGVHALLIGVGRYPHLKGGKSKTQFPHAGDIEQLTSPYHSVEAFADWLRVGLNRPGSPLRSLRVLASSPVKGLATHGWDEPDIKSIRKAVADWYQDCDRHSGNVAMFYFCGHGVVLGNTTTLLAQDFGKEEQSPFLGSFDPAAFADACTSAKASKQLFLMDACRSTPPELRRRYKTPTPPELLTPRPNSNEGNHQRAELFATELGASAYGVDDKPSVFMSSLLTSMKGAGAQQNDDEEWVVGTASLRTGLDWLVSREYDKKLQRVAFGNLSADFDLHTILGIPSVPVTVRTKPLAKLAGLQLQTDCPQYRAVPSAKPWHISVQAGKRSFFAGDAANPKQFSHNEDIVPQYRVISIPCGGDQ